MKSVEPIRKLSDIEKIKKYLSTNPRDRLLFIFGINTGLRISDILKLKVKDVKNKRHLIVTEQKTNKIKKVLIMNDLKHEIKEYIKDKKGDTYLFESAQTNNPISRIQAYRIINNACKKKRVKGNIGTHTLRKTFGYHFYQKTKDIALLQSIFNHSSPKITLRYIGINQGLRSRIHRNILDCFIMTCNILIHLIT